MAFQNLKSTGIAYLLGKLKTVFLQIKDAVKSVNGVEPDDDGDIAIRTVPYAQNLESESSQKDFATFVERTAGGSASINSGEAWLMSIMGNNEHDGFIPESLAMDVESEDITATIDRDTFVGVVSESGTTVLTYTSSWSADPATYGITVTGTPSNGDKITVVYVKEVRGTITVATPEKLIATGWNLYNHNSGNGYAKVVKYDDEMAFMIDGSYTALKFSATEEGTKTDITVTDGNFDPFANTDATSGYVWVTGGSASDTAIWMTWSDWTDGYDGEFAVYTEDEVNFSGIMTSYFPYGLLKAGSVADEIDFNLKQAVSRVERMSYSAENREIAESSGREYEFDENYIYLARTSSDIAQNTHTISVSGEINVDDHGLEFFTGTEVGVNSQILYGNNLKNKLERDVLTISQQTLTAGQKEQVRQNIGASTENDFCHYVGESFELFCEVFGHTTNSGKNVEIAILFPKLLTKVEGATFTKMVCSIRTPSGGYIVGSSTDMLNNIYSVSKRAGYIYVVLQNTNGWGVTNNINIAGAVSIMGTFI